MQPDASRTGTSSRPSSAPTDAMTPALNRTSAATRQPSSDRISPPRTSSASGALMTAQPRRRTPDRAQPDCRGRRGSGADGLGARRGATIPQPTRSFSPAPSTSSRLDAACAETRCCGPEATASAEDPPSCSRDFRAGLRRRRGPTAAQRLRSGKPRGYGRAVRRPSSPSASRVTPSCSHPLRPARLRPEAGLPARSAARAGIGSRLGGAHRREDARSG